VEERPRQPCDEQARRDQEEQCPEEVDPELAALGELHVEDVDAHVLVALERVRRAEHHDGGEQVPLDLEPRVARHVERVAHHRVARADEAGEQDAPVGDLAESPVHRVDQQRQLEQASKGASREGRRL
jgi:hypothetical protein